MDQTAPRPAKHDELDNTDQEWISLPCHADLDNEVESMRAAFVPLSRQPDTLLP